MNERNQTIAILGLIVLGIIAAGGAVALAALGQQVPEPLTALAGVCVGAVGVAAAMRPNNGQMAPKIPLDTKAEICEKKRG